ncbi:protein kinase domain-containing protein [Streptomyces sp. NPDC003327]
MTVIAGRYRLLDLLAEGATGTVWRARDETTGGEVAVKEVHAPPGLAAAEERRLHERIAGEARAAGRLDHPGIARVYDVAVERGRPWIVMELVRGLTLAETVEADGPLDDREAARVGADVLAALDAARAAGVPHRDPGPDRVLLANDGRTVVTGFGTATGGATAGTAHRADADTSAEARAEGSAEDLRAVGALLEAAVGGRPTGPLAAVVEGLLREDPEARTPADRAERELRRIAAGGTPDGDVRPASHPQDREARRRTSDGEGDGEGAGGGSGVGAGSTAGPGPGSSPTVTKRPPRGPRRGAVLAAGIVGALLLAGALAFHLLRDGEPGTGPGGGDPSSTAPAEPGATVTGNVPTVTARP